MTMPFGEKAAVIGGRKATQQITVLAGGAPAASPSPGGDYLTRLLADALYAPVNHSHPWSAITARPTTLAGYGITDAQPASAELTAIAGLSSPGYVRRTGPGAYSVVASIPQADVAGGPFLPLAAGAANVLTGPVYSGGSLANIPAAPLNLVNGAQGVMKTQLNLVNTAGFPGAGSAIDFFTYDQAGGTLPGVRIGAVDDNWSASFSVWTKTPGAASNPLVERLKISNAGLVTLSSLGAGFVRSSSAGLLSSSALAAADIPSLDASKITSGTFADARIASAATWNAKLATVTADSTSRAANTFYAAPSGAAGTATFRPIVAADIPTLNQNTTGSAAKWTTPRTLTIGATGKAVDGSTNVSWSLAEIGALAVGGTAVNSSALGGVNSAYFVQGTGAGAYGHRTTSIELTSPDNLLPSGFYDGRTSMPSGSYWTHMIRLSHSDPSNVQARWSFDLAANFAGSVGNGESYFVRTNTDVSWGAWRTLWHSGNLTAAAIGAAPAHAVGVNTILKSNGSGGMVASELAAYPGNYVQASLPLYLPDLNIWGTARSGDGGRWMHYMGGGAGGIPTGTTNALIQRYQYAGFSGFVVGSTEFYGNTISHDGTPAQYSIIAGKTGGSISFHVGGPTLVGSNYRAPKVGDWTNSGLAIYGTASVSSTLAWGAGAAIGSSDNVVQGYNGSGNSSITGAVSMASWRRSGFYAFSNPTDAPNSSNNWTHLIHSQGADWAAGSQYTFQIASSFSGGSNLSWGSEVYAMRVVTGGTPQPWRRLFFDRDGIIDTGTQLDFVPAGGTTYGMRITRSLGNPYVAFPFGFTATGATINTATFGSDGYNPAISSPDAAIGGMKQVASRYWSTSSVLPVMAANTWCFLVCDFTGGTNVMWTTNSTQTVTIRSGGNTYNTGVSSRLTDGGANFYANYRTMILVGPTVSTSSQCSVIVW